MFNLLVVTTEDDVQAVAAEYVAANRQMLDMWHRNGRAAFTMPEWAEAEEVATELRALLPNGLPAQLMSQVGGLFFCPDGFGDVQEVE